MYKTLTIQAIIKYIEDNIEVRHIDIESIVCFSGYSRRYLQIIFKEYVGIPIGRYIQLRRVSRAAVLLRLTSLTLANISEKLCYDSQQTFTREFKKHTGYTPLQYRNSELWTFRNLTGRKDFVAGIPAPDILHLEEMEFHGSSLSYDENIPYIGFNSHKKINFINKYFSQPNQSPIYASHDVHASSRNKIRIKFSFSIKKEHSCQFTWKLNAGMYAYFSFKGSIHDYINYINNVYMNVLPFYGLQKKNAYDLEIISKDINGNYSFEYYLPITERGPVRYSDSFR